MRIKRRLVAQELSAERFPNIAARRGGKTSYVVYGLEESGGLPNPKYASRDYFVSKGDVEKWAKGKKRGLVWY